MKSTWLMLALALFVSLAAGAQAEPAPAPAADFTVQQVCVDAADKPVAGDPAVCAARRKLRVGEPIPFRRVDAGNWQALYSYPVRGFGGEQRAVAEKIFGGNDTTGAYADLGSRSGFDLLEIGSRYVSAIRTSDPGGGDQIMWRNALCERADGWILFPPDLGPGQHGEARSTLKIVKGPSIACPRLQLLFVGPDYTVWDRPTEPYRFTSGKVLEVITSEHFAQGDPADASNPDGSMEKFFFTKEYGFSRWEAWQTPEACRKHARQQGRDVAAACTPSSPATCNGPSTATFFGKRYDRLDCRDSTFAGEAPLPPFNPLVNDAAPGDILSRNLLANGTFASGDAAWQPPPTVMRHTGSGGVGTLSCGEPGGRSSQAFVVPAEAHGAGRVLRWGGTLRPGPADTTVRFRLTLDQPGRAAERVEEVRHTSPGTPQAVALTGPMLDGSADAVTGRIEIACVAGREVAFDDVFVAAIDDPDTSASH